MRAFKKKQPLAASLAQSLVSFGSILARQRPVKVSQLFPDFAPLIAMR
jgi:hypothetical protein